jgi:phosphonate transport system substrate-binding protein
MASRALRFATFLAPKMLPLYRFIVRRIGQQLGCPTELFVGTSYEQLTTAADVSFVCGLPYVESRRRNGAAVEPLAAPVLEGGRYGARLIYFSDVIVRRDRPFRRFGDLRGCSWCYNEPRSQSGYGITRYHLLQLGETRGFFRNVVESG